MVWVRDPTAKALRRLADERDIPRGTYLRTLAESAATGTLDVSEAFKEDPPKQARSKEKPEARPRLRKVWDE